MSSLPADHNSTREPQATDSVAPDTSPPETTNPLVLLIFGGALFFALAAALLASG
jgi:hypothetical protein